MFTSYWLVLTIIRTSGSSSLLDWIGAEAFISSRHLMSLSRYSMSITIFNGLTRQTKHQLERFRIRTFHLQARRIWIKSLRLSIRVNRKNKHLISIKNRPLLNSKVLALWFKNTLKNLCCSRRENSTLEFGLWSTLMESATFLGIKTFILIVHLESAMSGLVAKITIWSQKIWTRSMFIWQTMLSRRIQIIMVNTKMEIKYRLESYL